MAMLVALFVASFAFSAVLAVEPVSSSVSGNDLSFTGFLKCGFNNQPLECAKTRAGRVLDGWDNDLQVQMENWGEAADSEVRRSGRQLGETQEPPSSAAHKLQMALNELTTILQKSLYRSMARKKEGGGGGLDSITISTGQQEKKKKMKKKKKPTNVHVHPHQQQQQQDDKGGDEEVHADQGTEPRQGALRVGGMAVDEELLGPGKTRVKREGEDQDSKDVGDGRGKKKKKRKAIIKLLLLGAVLKAKIGLLLQLLSAHLQVKFFAIALAGLALNIARFWLDLKKGHAPQKVIYYEHAQHQHHYEHDDDQGWGGYWSRSMDTQPEKKKEPEYVESSHSPEDAAYGGWSERAGQTRRSMRK